MSNAPEIPLQFTCVFRLFSCYTPALEKGPISVVSRGRMSERTPRAREEGWGFHCSGVQTNFQSCKLVHYPGLPSYPHSSDEYYCSIIILHVHWYTTVRYGTGNSTCSTVLLYYSCIQYSQVWIVRTTVPALPYVRYYVLVVSVRDRTLLLVVS